eukprot:g11849.t1
MPTTLLPGVAPEQALRAAFDGGGGESAGGGAMAGTSSNIKISGASSTSPPTAAARAPLVILLPLLTAEEQMTPTLWMRDVQMVKTIGDESGSDHKSKSLLSLDSLLEKMAIAPSESFSSAYDTTKSLIQIAGVNSLMQKSNLLVQSTIVQSVGKNVFNASVSASSKLLASTGLDSTLLGALDSLKPEDLLGNFGSPEEARTAWRSLVRLLAKEAATVLLFVEEEDADLIKNSDILEMLEGAGGKRKNHGKGEGDTKIFIPKWDLKSASRRETERSVLRSAVFEGQKGRACSVHPVGFESNPETFMYDDLGSCLTELVWKGEKLNCEPPPSSAAAAPAPSASSAAASIVDADAADRQKLWSVTTEYENLLQVQSEHFEAVLASRDKAIEQLQAGKAGYDYSNPQVVSLAVDERDREIRLYKCLLEIRDKQLMELQHVIDYGAANATPGDMNDLATEKNAQIQTLMDELQLLRNEVLQMKSSSSSSARGAGGGEWESHVVISDEVAQLRQDKESLEKILLQKERQIQAISTIDTANTDISALQLGARAISMYTEAMQMRQQLKEKDAAIATLNQELADLELRDQQRMNELEMKRGELADMTKVIADKTRRVLELENALQAARQELNEKTREIEGLCDAVEQARKNTLAEQGAKNRIIEELREELGVRDRNILEERAERVRMETLNEELQIKGNETLLQLKETQTTMDQMMAHTQYQGQLVRDMTSQVQESESRLHTLQVQEMYEKRRRAVAEKIREQETQQAMESKNVLLSQMSFELNETRDRLGNIRKDLEGDRGAGYLYGTHRVSLRLGPSDSSGDRDLTAAAARVIEALGADGKWLLLEELLREKLEQAQMLYSASST